jgi:hypothetical protein
MADKRGREYDPIKGAERKRKQRSDPEKRDKMNASSMATYRKYSVAYKEYMRNYHFMTKFGITAARKDELIAESRNICGICGGEFIDRKDAHLDHDHVTGKIRGLLCGSCNRKLGWFEKNRLNIMSYLTKR